MLCGKSRAFEHKLGMGSALHVNMGALIYRRLEAVQMSTMQSCYSKLHVAEGHNTLTFTTALGMLQQPEMTF